jgi:hypothetical protein
VANSAARTRRVTEGDFMLALLLVLVCVVLRILPHPPNFAPVGASGVLAGRTMRLPLAIAVVVASMALSNIVLARIHGYDAFGWGSLFVYAGFVLQVVLARALRRVRGGAIAAAAVGAVGFFVLSNLGVWAVGSLYPRDLAGLGACFVAALPFFAGTLAGDVLWTVVLVSVHRAVGRRLAGRRAWVSADSLAAPAL